MQRTRRQILDILKQNGRATLEGLSREIGLSPVTVRVHLAVLQRDDLVSVDEIRGKVGRPYFVYSLTEEAEAYFPKRYHALASRLLRTIGDELPADMSARLLRRMAEGWAAEHSHRLADMKLADRVAEVARIRSEEGALAEWERADGGFLLRQHNCPSLLVSREHPRVCEVEREYLGLLLGVPAVHADAISRGERICTFLVRDI